MWKERPKVRIVYITNDSGQLSIDFIVGLSIFMIALIMASTMAAGLLVGLQSKHVDYDAVAYRTAVMLVEDPGEPVQPLGKSAYTQPFGNEQWELVQIPGEKIYTKRFGLAVSKSTPAVISSKKYERFIDNSIYSNEDYKNKLLFSDYPYSYNVMIQKEGGTEQTIGDVYHENSQYGYIRRILFEKESGTIDVELRNHYTHGGGDGKINVELWSSDFLFSFNDYGSTYFLDPYRENVKLKLSFEGIPTNDPVSGDPILFRLEGVQCEYFPFTTDKEEELIVGTGEPLTTFNFIYRLPDGTEITPPYDFGFPAPEYFTTEIGRVLDNPVLLLEDKPRILITYDFGSTSGISGHEISDPSEYSGPTLTPTWMEVRVW